MNEKNTRSLGEPFKQIKIPGTEINVCYVFFHLIKFYWIYKTIQLQVNGNKGIQKEKKHCTCATCSLGLLFVTSLWNMITSLLLILLSRLLAS